MPPPPWAAAPGQVPPAPVPPTPGAYGAPQPFAQPQVPKSSGYAIASLVLGIASIPSCMCYGIVSLVCGILALVFYGRAMRDIEARIVSPSSANMAKAGRICGIIGIVLSLGFWVLFLIGISVHM